MAGDLQVGWLIVYQIGLVNGGITDKELGEKGGDPLPKNPPLRPYIGGIYIMWGLLGFGLCRKRYTICAQNALNRNLRNAVIHIEGKTNITFKMQGVQAESI
jgi:hypothetical protein